MPLRDLFRSRPDPEWKHPDVNVRLAALRQLGSDDQELVRSLAQEDPAPQVRRAAVRKIKDGTVLAALLAAEKDDSVREEACATLVATASGNGDPAAAESALLALSEPRHLAAVARTATLESIRRGALERLTDAKLLGQVARDAEDGGVRLSALEKIEDAGVIGSVAMGSEHRDVALAAVERVADTDALKPIAARAKSKAAARRARARIAVLSESAASASPQDRRRRQLRIVESLEASARNNDWDRLLDELATAEATWQEWSPDAEPALVERYEAARNLLQARTAAHEKEVAESEAKKHAAERAVAERTRICDRAEADAAGDAALSVDELRAEWNALEPFDDPEIAPLHARLERALHVIRTRQDDVASAQLLKPQAEALCVEAESAAEEADLQEGLRALQSVERRWSELHGPRAADPTLADRLRQAATRLRERQAQTKAERDKEAKDNAARIEALCVQLEKLAAQDAPTIKSAERALRESREAMEKPGPFPSKDARDAMVARLKHARQALYPKVQEQKENVDWQRWANVGVQEELCQKVEALLVREDIEAVAEELRTIDAAWKQASVVPRDKAEILWQRFRTAREQLRVRCDAFFAARAAVHAENAKKREALCERAEALAASTDWVKTATEIQALQAEWKTLGPTSRSKSKSLWERFHAACDAFFKRRKDDRDQRKETWSKNREQKEALCVRAEALAESQDWDATAAELRKLQADWKTIGPVDRKHSETQWQRFRGACNKFFERYGKRHEIAKAAVAEKLEALCQELESIVPAEGTAGAPPEGLVERLANAQTAWRQAGTVPEPRMGELATRFAAARSRIIAAYPDAFRGTELDLDANKKKMEKLCAKVEALVDELVPKKLENTTETLVAQLRNALASNTIGGKAAREERWRAASEEIEAAQAAWRRIGVAPGDPAVTALTQRFDRAITKLQNERPRFPPKAIEKRPAERRPADRRPPRARPAR
jgi:hypothetical protein